MDQLAQSIQCTYMCDSHVARKLNIGTDAALDILIFGWKMTLQ